MSLRRLRLILTYLVAVVILVGTVVTATTTRARWQPWLLPGKAASARDDHDDHPHGDRVKLTPQARKNLALVIGPIQVEKEYWRPLLVPGAVVDRPGRSDRGVTAPITGVVSKIHAFPNDTVKVGAPLFDLRITSEFLHNTQAELYKAAREKERQEKVVKRLEGSSGAIPAAHVIEARNQLAKLETQVTASRQILQSRGLTPAQLDAAAAGDFLRTVTVFAPTPVGDGQLVLAGTPAANGAHGTAYEVHELKAQLGEQVQAGQVLAVLANHRLLYIEGRGFKSEAAALARAAENGWPVQAEFAEDDPRTWPDLKQTLTIHHLANTVDPTSRTFAFFIPLENQARTFERSGKIFLVWRFRPGQRVRLHVPVEQIRGDPVEGKPGEFTGVIVLPRAAVVREGPEAYVFRANGDAFDRKPVRVLYEDRRHVVLANDGSVPPRVYVAQSAAAALNRVLKAQQSAGEGGHGHGHSH